MRVVRGVGARSLGVWIQVCAVGLSGAAPLGASMGAWPRVVMEDPSTAGALRLALEGAAQRLTLPDCQDVLSEFRDQEGRSLKERLAGLGATPPEYLDWIAFRDGSGKGACRNEGVLAFTVPGHRVVHVCGRQFQRTWSDNRLLAQAALIHEALHTLGLGENPPSSGQITRRVQQRCAL